MRLLLLDENDGDRRDTNEHDGVVVNADAGEASRQASSAAARHATLEVVIALCMFLLELPLLQEMRWPLLRNDDVSAPRVRQFS